MKKIFLAPLLLFPFFDLHSQVDQKKLLEITESIIIQQKKLSSDIQQLQEALGLIDPLESLDPLDTEEDMGKLSKEYTNQGLKEFKRGNFDKAKDAFQKAWEEQPAHVATNYNLGLAYHRLGNMPLAKKMLNYSLENRKELPGRDHIKAFLNIEKEKLAEKELSKDEIALETEIINLKNEMDSTFKSTAIPYIKRVTKTLTLLDQIVQKMKGHHFLIKKYSLELAEKYSLFELYGKSHNLLSSYEKAMEGEVLPEEYHAKLLEIAEKEKGQMKTLARYLDQTPERDVKKKLERDLFELEIFAGQMQTFVEEAESDDADFSKICERLGEFRWGGRPNRHVVVMNRQMELLYSSLEGTVSLDRYEDDTGAKFFREITFLPEKLKDKLTQFTKLKLNVGGKNVPYYLLYSYVPKHDIFIVVRIPKDDLV